MDSQADRERVASERTSSVGRPIARVDARDKVTGAARFADDVSFHGMLHAALTFPPVAHARLLGVDASEALMVGDWAVAQLWLFWLAPMSGALIAGFLYRWLGSEDAK